MQSCEVTGNKGIICRQGIGCLRLKAVESHGNISNLEARKSALGVDLKMILRGEWSGCQSEMVVLYLIFKYLGV
jgi:hypothetical protein